MAYSIAKREDAVDFMADYPGFGEMRWYSDAAGCEQVSFSWRSMPAGTGGRGSYGHPHPGQEEVYFVVAGRVTFKVGDDVFEAGPQTAVRVDGDAHRSVHNDTDSDAELLIFSTRLADPRPVPAGRLLAELNAPRAERRRPGAPASERLDAEAPDPGRHLDFVARQFSDPAVVPWHWPQRADGSGGPRTTAQAAELVERYRAQLAERGFTFWPWRERASGELVGLIGLNAAAVEERAGDRGRLVGDARPLGRGSGDRGRRGVAGLGLRGLRAGRDRLLHDAPEHRLAPGDGEARDGLRARLRPRGPAPGALPRGAG